MDFYLTSRDFQLLLLLCKRGKELFTEQEDLERLPGLENMFTFLYQTEKAKEKLKTKE
jgi:hypothetical protein